GDAERVVAPHQRYGDADEARAGGEVEEEAVLCPHDVVDRGEPGAGAAEAERGDDDTLDIDAAVARRALPPPDDADLVAPARVPEEEPDEDAGDNGEQEGEIERRRARRDAEACQHVMR